MNQYMEGRIAALRAYAVLAGNTTAMSRSAAMNYLEANLAKIVNPSDKSTAFREGFDYEVRNLIGDLQAYEEELQ